MIASMVAVLVVSALLVAWVYAGYPAFLAVAARVRGRTRRREPLALPISVIVAAHDEAPIIAAKVVNLAASRYPAELLEIIVASDGSSDATVAEARRAGATIVLDLPRLGKLRCLNHAVARASGEVLVFTDADSVLEPETLAELASNFADPTVGAVAANEVHVVEHDGVPVAAGEGLYWRYEQRIKRLEDRVGNAVSASGRLYAVRRCAFAPSSQTASTDDFVISTGAIRAGMRLAFDERSRVLVHTPEDGGTELWRKVRVMNRGLRGAFALARDVVSRRRWAYALQLVSHKILRRFVGFLLGAMLVASIALTVNDARWWVVLAPQLAVYGLAVVGAGAQALHRRAPKPAWVAYYFCLSNLAAALAVCSLVRGTRYERWEPALARGSGSTEVAL